MTGKKRMILIASVAVLVLGGGGGYYAYAKRSSASAASNFLIGEAKVGSVTKVVTATGTLQNKSIVNLSFGTAGRIASLKVQAGDTVKKGQVLAELDKSVLLNQVASSQANLKSAQAKLNSLQQGLSEGDLASLQSQITRAQADLENAKRNLELAKQNADSSYLQNQVQGAANQLSLAQTHYDTVSKTGDSVQIAMAKAQLDQANKNYVAAISAQSNTTQAQTQLMTAENALRTAQAAYDSAVTQLNSKKQPPTASDLAQAQAAVEQAQAALATSENNLAQATMIAPFDGVVTAVNPHEGEQIGGTAAVLSLQSTDSAPQLVVPVDEADISLVKVGQTATVTADSLPGKRFEASVLQIAPVGTTQNNVTTFAVTLSFTGDTSGLMIGQSLSAKILIEKRDKVLTVPSEAIRGVGNKRTVLVYKSGSENPVPTDVTTGLDDGTSVEIRSGLTEGQKIVLGTKSAPQSSVQGNPFGSGAGRGAGGFGGGGSGGRNR
ncbi:efflux RND transporter periplasmic adaptor subunit [Effusibacillus consociatus]|uniref:Efflux RND transporter periplasmic adaptor subunit n=1 Tax=Effusibacillus consociatus TaxID=1117041 RepID=A0ABV9Q5U8_9BACL